MASVHFVQKLALSVSLVILVTAAAMIGLSMLSAVNERKKDIGILRSLGYGKSQVFPIFCLEAGFIGALAGFIGYVGGFGASFKALDYLALAEGAVSCFFGRPFSCWPLRYSPSLLLSPLSIPPGKVLRSIPPRHLLPYRKERR